MKRCLPAVSGMSPVWHLRHRAGFTLILPPWEAGFTHLLIQTGSPGGSVPLQRGCCTVRFHGRAAHIHSEQRCSQTRSVRTNSPPFSLRGRFDNFTFTSPNPSSASARGAGSASFLHVRAPVTGECGAETSGHFTRSCRRNGTFLQIGGGRSARRLCASGERARHPCVASNPQRGFLTQLCRADSDEPLHQCTVACV